jgi:ribonuclease H2 subunit A
MDNRDEAMKDGDDINVNIEEILAAAENNESEFPEESQATSVPVTDISDRDEEVDLELDTNEPYRPPSALSANTALKDSYLWVSPRPSAPGPYVVGVDEAGRGPALGPLVYGMAFCPVSFVEEQLLEMGFDGAVSSPPYI